MLLILGMSPDEVVNAAVRMLLFNVNSGSCVDDMLQDQVWNNRTHIDIRGSVLAYPLTYYFINFFFPTNLANAERENELESLALEVSRALAPPFFFRAHDRRSLKRKWRVCYQVSSVPNLLIRYPRQGLLSKTLSWVGNLVSVMYVVCYTIAGLKQVLYMI